MSEVEMTNEERFAFLAAIQRNCSCEWLDDCLTASCSAHEELTDERVLTHSVYARRAAAWWLLKEFEPYVPLEEVHHS